jgi:hypothetical protein
MAENSEALCHSIDDRDYDPIRRMAHNATAVLLA